MKIAFIALTIGASSFLSLFALNSANAASAKKVPAKESADSGSAGSSTYLAALKGYDVEFDESSYPWLSEADATKLKSVVEKQDRKPSSLPADESNLSDEFKKFRSDFLSIKTSEQLATFLDTADAMYLTGKITQPDTQFVLAQLLPLRSLRGIVWKMMTVFQRSNFTHSLLLTSMKSVASAMKVYLPTEQWSAGFDYVTKPYLNSDKSAAKQFKNEGELMGWFGGPVYVSMITATMRIKALDLSKNPIVWDNILLYGKASFPDQLDRYRLVGEVERSTVLAGIHSTMAAIAFSRAYSTESMIALYQDLGHLYGVDGFVGYLNNQVSGAPTSARVAIMRKAKYQSYGMLLPDGAAWMRRSLNHLRESARLSSVVYNEALTRTPSEMFLYDNSQAVTNDRANKLRIANLLAVVAGPAELRSSVTGEKMMIDLPNFFSAPPPDLKAFLPTNFEQGSEMLPSKLVDAAGKAVPDYRNYFVGRPTGWDVNTYNRVFPRVKSSQEILDSVRILSQTWGTSMMALPFSSLVQ